MAMVKAEREALVATLFFEIQVAEVRKRIMRDGLWPPVCLSGTKKGPGTRFGNPGEDPKGPEVHPEELPGRPRSSEEQFGGCGNLEILSFMLRKFMVFNLGHFRKIIFFVRTLRPDQPLNSS